VLKEVFGGKKAMFCSQFVAGVLQDSGIKLFADSRRSHREEVAPSDFLHNRKLKMKFRGPIGDFKTKKKGEYNGRKTQPSVL